MSNFEKTVRSVVFIIILLLPAQPTRANQITIQASSTSLSPGDIGWSGNFTLNGIDQSGMAVAVDGSRVYIGGNFMAAGDVLVNQIVQWDGLTWTPLGDGLNGAVFALAVDGHGHLYAGGDFTQAGQNLVNHIARWDGQTWQALGSGTDGTVYAIAVDSAERVFAGGEFDHAGGMDVHQIAMWDGTSWLGVGGGVANDAPYTSHVYALTIDRFGSLFVGGFFNHAGGIPASNIARWDGSSWSNLGDGITGGVNDSISVYALAADSRGNVYAGGQFTLAGGINAENFARWNGDSWTAFGGGIQSTEKFKSAVTSILVDGGDIYVGGNFYAAGGIPMGSIARWNGSTWDSMMGGVWQDNYPAVVVGMAINRDGILFVAGDFATAGGKCAHSVAAWDGMNWSGLGIPTSTDGMINTMIPDQSEGYYAIGSFTCAGGQVVNHVAQWNGASWSALGGGLRSETEGTYPQTIALDHNGNLYIGGLFTQAGNTPANNIAKWNGSGWEALGAGLNGYVNTLAVDSQNRLYAGGFFYIGGNNPAQYTAISRWNGSQWEDLGAGINAQVTVLAFDGQDRLVAGGYFNTAGGVTTHGIARWNGQAWEALCDSYLDAPHALLFDGDTIYVGSATIMKIQNRTLELIGGGVSFPGYKYSTVRALALDQRGRLIVGGQFRQAGAVEANNIARWDGMRWEALGSGVGGFGVFSLSFDEKGKLWVAGWFSQAGGKVSGNLAIWTEPKYFWFPFISR